jgi:DNA-binding NtrC family response regulator
MARLLIVDDEHSVRDFIRRCLKDLGHDIREATDAETALTALTDQPADVVFCDVKMPGEDGVWLTGQIRSRYPRTAVVLATGVSTIPPSTSMRAGVTAYLVKPFGAAALTGALTTALQWCANLPPAETSTSKTHASLDDWPDELDKL